MLQENNQQPDTPKWLLPYNSIFQSVLFLLYHSNFPMITFLFSSVLFHTLHPFTVSFPKQSVRGTLSFLQQLLFFFTLCLKVNKTINAHLVILPNCTNASSWCIKRTFSKSECKLWLTVKWLANPNPNINPIRSVEAWNDWQLYLLPCHPHWFPERQFLAWYNILVPPAGHIHSCFCDFVHPYW